MTLLFAVSDLQSEMTAFRALAGELLAPGADAVLRSAGGQLAGIAKGRNETVRRWRIDEENPLLTMPSIGEYMPDERGGLTVHGEITFVWEIQPVRPTGDTRPAAQVRLSGLASTRIRLFKQMECGEAEEVAVWRMEVADLRAPGTFFHVQVLGRENDKIFPKELDVPRLPGVLNSPFACMEFVLGELFQKRWAHIAQKDSGPCRQWRAIQARRHSSHLDWAARQVENTSGSPWVAWKAAKPEEGLFLPSKR